MSQIATIQIGSKKIGEGHPCFIVAEVSANHGQDLEVAKQIVRAAAAAGADAVKLQTYTPDTITLNSRKQEFLVVNKDNPDDWKGRSLHELYQHAYTPWEWHAELKELAESVGLIFFSTPFDFTAVDFLESLQVPCYKIASYECTDIPLLKKVAATGKPVIMSVGFATEAEITESVLALREGGAQEIILLHCSTSYSTDPSAADAHLRNIQALRETYGVQAGFSDNNFGISIPVLAVAAGACVIEKHMVAVHASALDDAFSLDPQEFTKMVQEIRKVERTLGTVAFGPANAAEAANTQYRRSLFVAKSMKKGETFTPENLRSVRPAAGLPTKYYEEILGKTARQDIEEATPLSWDLVEK